MSPDSSVLIWEEYVKENKLFIAGDWFANYQAGIIHKDRSIEDHYIDNFYDIFFRNYFLTFMIRNRIPVIHPEIEERNDAGTFKDHIYYIIRFQPYYDIFKKYIPIEGDLEEQEIKNKMRKENEGT